MAAAAPANTSKLNHIGNLLRWPGNVAGSSVKRAIGNAELAFLLTSFFDAVDGGWREPLCDRRATLAWRRYNPCFPSPTPRLQQDARWRKRQAFRWSYAGFLAEDRPPHGQAWPAAATLRAEPPSPFLRNRTQALATGCVPAIAPSLIHAIPCQKTAHMSDTHVATSTYPAAAQRRSLPIVPIAGYIDESRAKAAGLPAERSQIDLEQDVAITTASS